MTFLDRLLRYLASILLLSLLIAVVAGVISRQIDAPLPWTDELAQYLLVWTGFVGWVLATRRHSHIRITVLTDRLPQLATRGLEVATQCAIAAFGAGLIWYAIPLIRRNWDVESIALPVTAAFLYLPLPALGFALLLQAVVDGYAALTRPVHVDGGQVL